MGVLKDQNDKNTNLFNHSNYESNKIRAEPFKWINFPVFVGIWFILFWFIICPIVWSRVYNHFTARKHWPSYWPYYFWITAFLIFCVILAILLLIWKLYSSKSKEKYGKVFLNPQYGDNKEEWCLECSNFHQPGKNNCIVKNKNKCCKCGQEQLSFGECCMKKKELDEKIVEGPSYDIVLRKQQPDSEDIANKRRSRHLDKRGSLKNRHSTSSNVVITMHDIGTKELINRTLIRNEKLSDEHKEKSFKKKKPPNLQPVNVELANRQSNVEFFGEKIPMLKEKTTKTEIKDHEPKSENSDESDTPKCDVVDMESMKKESFNKYLHLVEINTPFTPPDSNVEESTQNEPLKSPMSPREIFFYDLIQAADKSGPDNSPDSVNLGLQKKRPISHILLSSDVDLDVDTDEENINELKRKTIGHVPTPSTVETVAKYIPESELETTTTVHEKKFTVKILRTVQKTIVDGKVVQNTVVEEKKIVTPTIDSNTLFSEQESAQDLFNLKKESVSEYFISDLPRAPIKPHRTISQRDTNRDNQQHMETNDDNNQSNLINDADDNIFEE